ncbi:unnamed protein product [Prunus armeniaca]
MANDLTSLIANVNISEVKNSLFNIGGPKTTGVDGFQRVSIKTNGIYVCVSSVTYQICVNGELIESFTLRKGIRQGDPLSPYLFMLCIEKLSHIIVDVVGKHTWKPVKSSQSALTISHLFFADDLILFAEASPYQARLMKQCLELFCKVSGQIVNFDKSAIYCSPNISKDMATDISRIYGSPFTDDLGRATLIQAVTSAIPVYVMQTAKIPISIYENLDRLNRKSAHLPGRAMFGAQLLHKGLVWRLGKEDKDTEKLRGLLPEKWVQKVIGCPADFGGLLEDCQIWQPTSNGIFSIKSTYNMMFKRADWLIHWWKVIWKLKIPPKLQIFFWLTFQEKILTNEQWARRHLVSDPTCNICDCPTESTLHIMCDCPRAKRVWKLFVNTSQTNPFFQAEMHPWLLNNLCSKNQSAQIPWRLMFVFICWYIWKWRNDFIFNNAADLPFNSRELIINAVRDWVKATTNIHPGVGKIQIMLAWTSPDIRVLKLNVDGSRKGSTGSIGAGRVIRDHAGYWIVGYSANLR